MRTLLSRRAVLIAILALLPLAGGGCGGSADRETLLDLSAPSEPAPAGTALVIDEPAADTSVRTNEVTVRGSAPPGAEVRLDQLGTPLAATADAEGKWQYAARLVGGRNTLRFTLANPRDGAATLTLTYEPANAAANQDASAPSTAPEPATSPSALSTQDSGLVLPPLPPAWPAALQLGISDGLGGAAGMRATAAFGLRYQYLAGGVNTGNGWTTWEPKGSFVAAYIQESVHQGITPILTYYMLYQSKPGHGQEEAKAVATNLQSQGTMTAYYNDLKLVFQQAGASRKDRVVLHVEPDLWGYLQQRAKDDNAATVPAKVASTGLPELAGLPENASGFARAIVALRDRYAPNVLLGYHISVWGTGKDIIYTNPALGTVDALATRSANFQRSLGASFDLAFAEFTDRDAGFKQEQYKDGGASWWDAADFALHGRFLATFVRLSGKRVVLWQIPQGNTKMRAMNNTWNHYQDNKVEWLLDDPDRAHLNEYINAGVIGFLFGRGADGATCACDANNDGVTNPEPINGNIRDSLNADDDGGYFRERVQAYYTAGPLALPAGAAVP